MASYRVEVSARKVGEVVTRRASPALLLALILPCLSACHRPERARHEALAKSFARPVAKLCGAKHKEGGGCHGECLTKGAADEGKAALDASSLFITVAPVGDPQTEALVEDVRRTARAIQTSLAACAEPIDWNAPLTSAATQCAEARARHGALISKLEAAVDVVATSTEKRTGVRVPRVTGACRT